jgi:putative flippase GtrA
MAVARPRIVVGAVLAAFAVAVTNNFLWNRYWTFGFGSGEGQVEFQAVRFFVVSIASLGRT